MIQGNSQVKMHTQGKTHMMNLSIFQRCYNTILPAVEVTYELDFFPHLGAKTR